MRFVQAPDKEKELRLTRMFTQYGDQLTRLCYLSLGDLAMAEDAVQETFVKAFRHMDSFRGESGEKTWLFAIAINTCRDFRRTAWFSRIDRRVTPEDLPEAAVPFTAADDTLMRAILKLKPKYKEVILLYYYQQWKLSDIAGALSLPVNTVSTRLRRAREMLRPQIERWYFDEGE